MDYTPFGTFTQCEHFGISNDPEMAFVDVQGHSKFLLDQDIRGLYATIRERGQTQSVIEINDIPFEDVKKSYHLGKNFHVEFLGIATIENRFLLPLNLERKLHTVKEGQIIPLERPAEP